MKRIAATLAVIGLAWLPCIAQEQAVEPFLSEQIAAMQPVLKAQADASNGTATRQLVQYPNFYNSLIYRDKSGEVEIHQDFDEVMVVLQGAATLRTGGATENMRPIRPGELRGTSSTGATPHPLKEGAVVHITANTPHQVFIAPGGHIFYVDVKIKHIGDPATSSIERSRR